MRNLILCICSASLIFGCSDSETSKTVVIEKLQDSIIIVDTILETIVPEIPRFNMHPIPDFEVAEGADLKYPDVLCFKGKIGEEPISMLLEQYNDAMSEPALAPET